VANLIDRKPPDASMPLAMSASHPDAAGSYGPEAVRWVREEVGIELWWWQQLAMTMQLEHDSEGRLLRTYVTESTPRRQGKSIRLKSTCLWRVGHADLLGEPQTVLFTGKDLPICKEIHSSAWAWAAARGWKVARGMGNEAIIAPDLSRWLVRSQNGVYGYPAGMGACDESWAVPDAVIREGLQPALMQRPNPQLLLTSSAHTAATVLMRRRVSDGLQSLRSGGKHLLLLWGAALHASEVDPDDPAVWRSASPQWGPQREELIADAWQAVLSGTAIPDPLEPDPVAGFKAQYLNIWPDLSTGAAGLVEGQVWAGLRGSGEGPVLGVGVEAERGQPPVVAVVRGTADGLLLSVQQCASMDDAVSSCAGFGVPPQVGMSLLHDPGWEPLGAVKCQGTARDLGGVFASLCRDGVIRHDGGELLQRVVLAWSNRPEARHDAVKAAVWAVKAARSRVEAPAIW
jgi:hypothetical protein